jgi:RHH-type proline utilization regulon transcriptional repressor/proline dehydrogenase/delta 1-pyrroline-5-carboxylate dehydrogenase
MLERSRNWLFERRDADIPLNSERLAVRYLADESETVRVLVTQAKLPERDADGVKRQAKRLVEKMRQNRRELGGLDAFMGEYDLSSREGIVLMCLAEALLRIPDDEVAADLIADKLTDTDFERHLGRSESVFVNATTWALMLTGQLNHAEQLPRDGLGQMLARMANRLGEPVIRAAMRQAMRIMARQFVMGRTIEDALQRAARGQHKRYRYSYDMLGEAAMTAADATRYMDAYSGAIATLGEYVRTGADLMSSPGISVKLSALCPRFEYTQSARAVAELRDRVETLAAAARDAHIALTLDAEEADRLELTLEIFRQVLASRRLRDWPGLGLAVQAYQKRALHVVEWIEELAASTARVVPVRLVKGAYWDTEIKRAQEQGLSAYPVFTRKSSTDVSYLACARRLLQSSPHLYPQFATHNAHSVAWILHVGAKVQFEFQRLHGMGEELYSEIVSSDGFDRPCRVYAPVGSHETLLPYLVRRLLENGANTSFVNRIAHEEASLDEIVRDPVAVTEALGDELPHPRIPLPCDIFGAARRNSAGINLADARELLPLAERLARAEENVSMAGPLIDGRLVSGRAFESLDPSTLQVAGEVALADAVTASAALAAASEYFPVWSALAVESRSELLRQAADTFEQQRAELAMLCVAEGGRTVGDSLSEVREAVDFLRYYAGEAERLQASPTVLPGPTGESNSLRRLGRGVFLCISPWNFPVAIFTGQIAAALAVGNTVVAKPAQQTSLVAARVVTLLHEAGIPTGALQFLPGEGAPMGDALLPDSRLAGVVFTGSTATAKRIAVSLAKREGPLAAFIAETGGINTMIVDSSALPEQVVKDAILSAFNSAGQRCSALRLLCLQEDTADTIIPMLKGAMAQLSIGDPRLLSTDLGPVIDVAARDELEAYVADQGERVLYRCSLKDTLAPGLYVAPTLIEVQRVMDLTREVFGPVLHVLRYRREDVDRLLGDINRVGYGLTLGVHSRLDTFAQRIAAQVRVGNIYVNRNMIGAVVGVQPFGGMGLSGTGPKAGGPHYLERFVTEQTLTVNTAAIGGNASLLSLQDSA